MFRLIADDGKILTNGEVKGRVVDVPTGKVQDWMEIEDEKDKEE